MDIQNNKESCLLAFRSAYRPLLRGKGIQEISRLTNIPLSLLKELEQRGVNDTAIASNKVKKMARVLSFCLKGKKYFTSDSDIAKETNKTLQFAEDDLNWKILEDQDWINLAESITIVGMNEAEMSDQELDKIADEVTESNFLQSALKDWKSKAPEQFKNILESE